jgi:hypothetical protein
MYIMEVRQRDKGQIKMTTKYYKAERATAREAGTLLEAGFGVEYLVRPVTNPGALEKHPEFTQHLTVWVGRSNKPVVNYRVKEASVGKYLSQLVEKAEADTKLETERATIARLDKAQYRNAYQVGALCYNSWGYDQTNIDFYEVVARSKTGATITFRKISKRKVCDTDPREMRQNVSPCPGEYIGEAFKKRVNQFGPYKVCTVDTVKEETSYA